MTDEFDHSRFAKERFAKEIVPADCDRGAPFRSALLWVAFAWAVGALIVGGACLLGSPSAELPPMAVAVITIGSGLIACGAMACGGWVHRWLCPPQCPDDSGPTGNPAAALLTSTVAGMFLRLFGTVALFLTCRYHLAASVSLVGVMIVGWYLYLTTVEVTVLARALKRIDPVSRDEHRLAAVHRPNLDARP